MSIWESLQAVSLHVTGAWFFILLMIVLLAFFAGALLGDVLNAEALGRVVAIVVCMVIALGVIAIALART